MPPALPRPAVRRSHAPVRSRLAVAALLAAAVAPARPARAVLPTSAWYVGGNGDWVVDLSHVDDWLITPPPVPLSDFFLYPDNSTSRLFTVFTSLGGDGNHLRLNSLLPVSVSNLNVLHTDTLEVKDSFLQIDFPGLVTNDGTLVIDNGQLVTSPLVPGLLTLAGSGEVRLSGDSPAIGSLLGAVTLQGQNVTGKGLVTGTVLTFNSDANANVPGEKLELAPSLSGSFDGTLRATSGGTLRIHSAVGQLADVTSAGLILADGGVADLRDMDFENNGTVRAVNGGAVTLKDTPVDNAGHLFDVQDLSQMTLRGDVAITGGTLQTSAAGLIVSAEGVNSLAGTMTLRGNFQVAGTRLDFNPGAYDAADATVDVRTLARLNNVTIRGGHWTGPGQTYVLTPSTLDGTASPLTIDATEFYLPGSNSLTLRGTIRFDNDGLLTVEDHTLGFGTYDAAVRIDGNVLLDGAGGGIRFGAVGHDYHENYIRAVNDGLLTLGPHARIQAGGAGHRGYIDAPIVNHGTIDADGGAITLLTTDITNTGSIGASAGGNLYLAKGFTLHNAGGRLTAADAASTVWLNRNGAGSAATTIAGGALDGTGTFLNSGTTLLDGSADPVTLDGALLSVPGNTVLFARGTIHNSGRIYLHDDVLGYGTVNAFLRADGPVTMDGTGEILFAPIGHSNNTNELDATNGGTLTLGPDVTVRTEVASGGGDGWIRLPLTNFGHVLAEGASSNITFDNAQTVNHGLIEAKGGGHVHVGRATGPTLLDNTDATLLAGAGSWFDFSGSAGQVPALTTLRGGTLTGGGEFRMGPAVLLDGVAQPVTARSTTLAITAGQLATVRGELALDQAAISLTDTVYTTGVLPRLRASGNARLSGTGTLLVQPGSGSEATLDAPGGGSWTFDPGISALVNGNTAGTIRDSLTNHGTVRADAGTWYLTLASLTNDGTIESLNGGNVTIGNPGSSTTVYADGGTFRAADAASTISLSGVAGQTPAPLHLHGGRFEGPGTVRNLRSVTLDNRDAHPITIAHATFLADSNANTYIYGDLALDGATLRFEHHYTSFGNVPPHLTAQDNARITGAGRLEFAHGYLDSAAGASWTLGPGITAVATTNAGPTMSGPVTNQGRILADAGTWFIRVPTLTNTGTIETVNGGAIATGRFGDSMVIDNAGGTLRAGPGTTFTLSGVAGQTPAYVYVNGGTLDGAGTFANGRWLTLDGRDAHPITLRDATFLANTNAVTNLYGDLTLDGSTLRLIHQYTSFGNVAPSLVAAGGGDARILGAGTIDLRAGRLDATAAGASFTLGDDVVLSVPSGFAPEVRGPLATHGTLHTDGDLYVTAGTTTVLADGAITGAGNIRLSGTGALVNYGTLSPGNSPGTLTIFGSLTQADTSTLLIELAGSDPALRDALRVTRTLFLAGRLDVRLLDGYLPDPSDTFTFLTASQGIVGGFSNLADGLLHTAAGTFAVTQTSTQVTLSNFIPAPEPSAAILLPIAAVATLTRRRRRPSYPYQSSVPRHA